MTIRSLAALAAAVVAWLYAALAPGVAADDADLRWASFGDSYAAGEGLEHPSRDDVTIYGTDEVAAGSGETSRHCQRALAEDAYPSVAWGATLAEGQARPFAFVACTGAITDDLFPDPEGRLQAGQLEQARYFSGEETFDVVTLSFGGNNVGFADIIFGCAGVSMTGGITAVASGAVGWLNAPWVGCTVSEEEMKSRVDALTDIGSVDDQPDCSNLGDSTSTDGHWDDDGLTAGRITLPELFDVIGRCVAPDGAVIVMGYPQLLEEPRRWGRFEGNRCNRIRRADAAKLRGAGAHLNYRTRQAVEWAASRTRARFVFVDPNDVWEEDQPENSHALCGAGEDWLNGLTVGIEGDGNVRVMRSFHPNQLGHDAMARAASRLDLTSGSDYYHEIPGDVVHALLSTASSQNRAAAREWGTPTVLGVLANLEREGYTLQVTPDGSCTPSALGWDCAATILDSNGVVRGTLWLRLAGTAASTAVVRATPAFGE